MSPQPEQLLFADEPNIAERNRLDGSARRQPTGIGDVILAATLGEREVLIVVIDAAKWNRGRGHLFVFVVPKTGKNQKWLNAADLFKRIEY